MEQKIVEQSITLGERILDDESLYLVLPNWQEVINQIQQIKQTAIQVAEYRDNKKGEQQPFDYNNVISILGERGSGKSSVLLTLLQKLKTSVGGSRDVFLDVIVPELLEDSSDVLGVILLNFKAYIESNKEQITKHYQSNRRGRDVQNDSFNSCLYKEKTKLDELWDKVFTLYIYRKKGSHKVMEEHFSGVSHYTQERKEALISELELREKLREFFDELIVALNGSVKGGHLIHISFDDADLNPRRCYEVLNVVLKYLNHPNIVTFVSGDIWKFQEDLVGELLLQHHGQHFRNVRMGDNGTVLHSQKELAYDFLKKIMPYSRRFSLQKLSSIAKMDFKLSANKLNDEDSNTVQEPASLQQLINYFFEGYENPFEWINKEDDRGASPLKLSSVFSIFDDKPRGLLTFYSYLYSNLTFISASSGEFEQRDDYYTRMYAYFQKMFAMIIETNNLLRKHQNRVLSLYTLTGGGGPHDTILIEVHHDKLLLDIQDFPLAQRHEFVMIIHFLFFAEMIVKRDFGIINSREYSIAINNALGITDSQRVIPVAYDIRIVFALYSELSRVFNVSQIKDIYNNKIYFNKYVKIIRQSFANYNNLFAGDTTWLDHYDKLSETYNRKLVDIKQTLLEQFKEFSFDTSVLDRLTLEYYESNGYLFRTSLNEDFPANMQTFEELSIYFNMIYAKMGDSNQHEFEEIERKARLIDDIMHEKQFGMGIDISRAYDKLYDRRVMYDETDIVIRLDHNISKLKIFRAYLIEQMQRLIKTRSIYNEKLLVNRINDGRMRVMYQKAQYDYSELNYDLNLPSVGGKENEMEQYYQNQRIIRWDHQYPYLKDLSDGEDTNNKKSKTARLFILSDANIPNSTETKTVNAFNRYLLIQFFASRVDIVDEMMNELETSYIVFVLQEIEATYKHIFDMFEENNSEGAASVALMNCISNMKLLYQAQLSEDIEKRDALNRIFKMRNELLKKFESLQAQYEMKHVAMQQLNTLITKIRDETLVSELKNIQRKLLSTGSVSQESFDSLLNRMKSYLGGMEDNRSYAVIELKDLSRNLVKRPEKSIVGEEMKRIVNEAKERVYRMQLEELIQAAAYVYNKQYGDA